MHWIDRIRVKPYSICLIAFCLAILVWTAVYPFCRTALLTPITSNEGWNVYNTQKVAEHQPLYPSEYGWTTVNYPALSFHLVALLGKFTTEFLFTARILSLVSLCLLGVLGGMIVSLTTRSKLAAWLTGLFLVAMFCACDDGYVGMDDPQMLAQVFFLAGIYVYLRGNRKAWAVDATALLFVVGGNIKHNLIEFPLAVLLDLLLTSPRRALRFAVFGLLLVAASVALTSHLDGSAYVACLLAPRGYSALEARNIVRIVLLPLLLPAGVAVWTALYCWKNPSLRVLALLLFSALAIDAFFAGGDGVDINIMFGSMLAIALLTGVFWAKYPKMSLSRFGVIPPVAVCTIFFIWLAVPMVSFHHGRPNKALAMGHDHERLFAAEVTYLQQQPGPALCEEVLLCAYAGKPYLYDPFNAWRFVKQGRLDPNVIVDHLRNREYGTVQLYSSVELELDGHGDPVLIPTPILLAIQRYYRPGFENKDGIIYLPTAQDALMHPKLAVGH